MTKSSYFKYWIE